MTKPPLPGQLTRVPDGLLEPQPHQTQAPATVHQEERFGRLAVASQPES